MRAWAFAGWVAAGALAGLSVVGAASIGVLVVPFAVAAAILVSRRTRYPLDVLGVVAGLGIPFLGVAWANRDSHPCAEGGFNSCGGFDPHPWLAIGLVLTGSGIAMYVLLRLASRVRPCRRSTS